MHVDANGPSTAGKWAVTGDNTAANTLTDFEAASIINASLDISDNGGIFYSKRASPQSVAGRKLAR